MTIFGPHCDHDECSWTACDGAESEAAGVLFGCKDQKSCPYCGPTSPSWNRLAAEWLEWCHGWGGTTSSAELVEKGAPVNVIATARLVETHYRTG